MTGHEVIRVIQNIPLPRRDDFCIRAMVMAMDKNKSIHVTGWVAARAAQLATRASSVKLES